MLSDLNRFAFYFVRIGIDFAYYFVAEATFRLPCLFLLCIVFKVRGRLSEVSSAPTTCI